MTVPTSRGWPVKRRKLMDLQTLSVYPSAFWRCEHVLAEWPDELPPPWGQGYDGAWPPSCDPCWQWLARRPMAAIAAGEVGAGVDDLREGGQLSADFAYNAASWLEMAGYVEQLGLLWVATDAGLEWFQQGGET